MLRHFKFSSRRLFLIGGLASICFLIAAYLLEHFEKLTPCPLCILQRGVFYALAAICLLSFIHHPKKMGNKIYAILLSFVAILGIILAGRQVYLQHLPKEAMPPCTAGLEKLLEFNPWAEVLRIVLTASGECGHIDYVILGQSLAMWSLIIFIGYLIWGMIIFLLNIFQCEDKNLN